MLAITTAGVELYLTSAWSCVILINITRLWYKSILMLLFFLFTQLKVVNLFFQQCSIYRHTLRTKWIVFLLHHLGRTVQHVENKASFWLLLIWPQRTKSFSKLSKEERAKKILFTGGGVFKSKPLCILHRLK